MAAVGGRAILEYLSVVNQNVYHWNHHGGEEKLERASVQTAASSSSGLPSGTVSGSMTPGNSTSIDPPGEVGQKYGGLIGHADSDHAEIDAFGGSSSNEGGRKRDDLMSRLAETKLQPSADGSFVNPFGGRGGGPLLETKSRHQFNSGHSVAQAVRPAHVTAEFFVLCDAGVRFGERVLNGLFHQLVQLDMDYHSSVEQEDRDYDVVEKLLGTGKATAATADYLLPGVVASGKMTSFEKLRYAQYQGERRGVLDKLKSILAEIFLLKMISMKARDRRNFFSRLDKFVVEHSDALRTSSGGSGMGTNSAFGAYFVRVDLRKTPGGLLWRGLVVWFENVV